MEKYNEKLILGIVLGASAIIGTVYFLAGGGGGTHNGKQTSFEGGYGGESGSNGGNIMDSEGGGGVKNGLISGVGGGIVEGERIGNG